MSWDEWLQNKPVLTDGAWGTELQKRGLAPGADPDVWNLEHPERVREVAASYAAAGSRVILTNTFRANPVSLGMHGLAEKTGEINRAGVRISREAAEKKTLVFASIGPTGKMLLTKEISEQQMKEAFAAQARALAEEGPDALLLETMTDLTEARIAAEAALETRLPVIVSMVFDSGKNRDRTIMGTTPEQAAAALEAAGVQAVGANCGSGIRAYVEICRRLCAATKLPVWIKPNAGLPEMLAGKAVYRTTPEAFAAEARELAAAGAAFIGGCCGTSPDFIRAMAATGLYAVR